MVEEEEEEGEEKAGRAEEDEQQQDGGGEKSANPVSRDITRHKRGGGACRAEAYARTENAEPPCQHASGKKHASIMLRA